MMRHGSSGLAPRVLARLGRRSMNSAPGVRGTRSAELHKTAAQTHVPAEISRDALRVGARQETLRESNLVLLAEEIFAAGEEVSRAELALRTAMTRSTVSRLVEDLLAAGIVREGSPRPVSARGRPAVPLTPASGTLLGVGIEINVDFIAARVLDLTGAVLAEEVIASENRHADPGVVLRQAGELGLRVVAAADASVPQASRMIGTVVAIPGLVASDQRSLLFAPNLGWKDIDVVDLLSQAEATLEPKAPGAFGAFITVVNEAKLAALAMSQTLTTPEADEQTFLYVSAQMGIGSAAVIHGVVESGPHGWGGELGHVTVEPNGPECGCGAHGCLEVYAGKHVLLAAAKLSPAAHVDQLVDAIQRQDDPDLMAAVDRAGWAMGVALSTVMNILDVHKVVLGGAFAPLIDLLRPGIETELRRRVLAAPWTHFSITASPADTSSAATGAALLALRAVVESPLHWVPTGAVS